ncbi:MAG: hypothetical protein PUJ55_10800 [Clostridiales bacterium]|nr:hypothetical protein [Roseburia sp.]MDD7637409.1 hypothetical protein [Clostridiales bacterium]MDY4111967.1 hypothetical protein [Roseburia sp.]
MKGILWISGIGVDDEEMEEMRKAVRRINQKRKAEKREKLDYVCLTKENVCLNSKLANR